MDVRPAESPRLLAIAAARRQLLDNGSPDAALAPWIERSWRRCLASGQTPGQRVVFDSVSAAALRRVQDNNHALASAARPVLERLASAMAETRYFAILTDAQGVAITVSGPVDRQDRRATAIARIGVDLSERAIGTSAIGAALAEQQPVWLHRGEHFFDDNGSYSCAGAPLRGPDGRCVGMLDLTGIDVPERPALKHLVTLSARGIENGLLLAQPHRLLLRLNWPGHAMGQDGDGLLTLDADGRVSGSNRIASDLLGLADEHGNWHASDLFATPWETLFDAARGRRGPQLLPLWSGLRLQVLATLPGEPAPPVEATRPGAARVPLRDLETELIHQAVRDAHGNVAQAARALGIGRATVYRKLGRKP